MTNAAALATQPECWSCDSPAITATWLDGRSICAPCLADAPRDLFTLVSGGEQIACEICSTRRDVWQQGGWALACANCGTEIDEAELFAELTELRGHPEEGSYR